MKLFVSDLDGTLYPPNVTDSGAENRAAIQRWRAAGNVFAVATARIHQAYPKVSADLGFAVDFLGGNGAELIFSDGTRMTRTLKAAVFLDVAGWLARHHVDATVKMNCQGQWISSDCRHYPYGHPHRLRRSLLDSVTLAETTVDPNAEILNLGIIIRPDQRDGVKRALREKLAGTVEIVSSDFDNLDLVRPDCSKAAALGILAERIGVPLREVIVIGDSENDVGMFDVVETSYCMAQAEPEVRQKARWVVTSVAEALTRESGRG